MSNAYTKPECEAINAAWQSIADLCDCTNWNDPVDLKEATSLERRQMESVFGARAMIAKAWHEGLSNPDKPARDLYWMRPGYMRAFMLGVRHAVERAGKEYTGPMVEKARQLCVAAIEANDAHTARIVGA